MDSARLRGVVHDLEIELRDAEARVSDIRGALDSVRKLLGTSSAQVTLPLAPEKNGNGRTDGRDAVQEFLADAGNPGMTLTRLSSEMFARGLVGVKTGKPSRETVRGWLLKLQKAGVTEGRKNSDSAWAETIWYLTPKSTYYRR